MVTSRLVTLDGRTLATRQTGSRRPPIRSPPCRRSPFRAYLSRYGVVLVALSLTDAAGPAAVDNFLLVEPGRCGHAGAQFAPGAAVRLTAHASIEGQERVVHLGLQDTGAAPALAAKLTLVDEAASASCRRSTATTTSRCCRRNPGDRDPLRELTGRCRAHQVARLERRTERYGDRITDRADPSTPSLTPAAGPDPVC